MTISRILTGITRNSLYVLIFLIPLFFLPFTSEFLEFNKQYLVYALVSIGFLAWFIRGFIERKFTVTRTALDIPLLMLWLAVLAASIFSKDRTLSFFGSYERLTMGFIPMTFYVLFFYLLVNYLREGKYLKRFFVCFGLGGALSAVYFWLKIFGLTIAGILPAWNLSAGTNGRFGIILLIPMLIGFIFLMQSKLSRKETILWSVISAFCFVTALALGYKMVFIAGAIGAAIALIFILANLQGVRISASSVLLVVFLLFLVFTIFGNFGFLTVSSLPAEVSLAQGASWHIAGGTLKEGLGRALLGSGPATYVYDFSAHRPENFNNNIFWSLRFATPYSEGSGLVATIGVLGSVIVLLLVLALLRFFKSIRVNSRTSVYSGILFRGSIAMGITLFILLLLTPFGTVLWIYLFALLAVAVVSESLLQGSKAKTLEIEFEGTPQSSLATSFGSIIIVVVFVVLGIYLGRFYVGEVYFQKGLKDMGPEKIDQRITYITQARTFNPQRVRYLLALTELQFQQALIESQKEAPDQVLISRLISSAVGNVRYATNLAPNSTAAWETLGGMYINVIGIAPDARSWAIDSYNRAIELEPTNPMFYVLRGNLYQGDNKMDEARKDYERALELKPDYVQAYAALAVFFEVDGDLGKAIENQFNAVRFARGDLNVAYNLARLYFNRKEGNDDFNTEDILKQILALNPDHANALFTLGSLYERQGKIGDAIKQFEHVLELDSDNDVVKRKMEALRE